MIWPWARKQRKPEVTFRLPPYDPETGTIGVGLYEDGTTATLKIGNTSGIVVGGLPGSGKSAGMVTVTLPLFLSGQARIHIIDGKGGDDWSWAARSATTYIRDDIDRVHVTMLGLDEAMKNRLSSMRSRYGDSNFWNVPPDRRPPLEVIVIDECQTYFDLKGVLGGKEQKAKATDILAAATDIVKKGRSAGYTLICCTQKPTVDSLPSALRDNCGVRVCFRVTTPEAARAVLGDLPDDSPRPTDIPPARRGGAVITTDDGTARMCRFAYIPESQAENTLAGHSISGLQST